MLEQKRIKEAEEGVREYLQEGKLFRPKAIDKNILATYRRNADYSLVQQISFVSDSNF